MLAAAILATVLVLLCATFGPAFYERIMRRKEPFQGVVSMPAPVAIDILTDALNNTPDVAEITPEAVTLYIGGAASPSVVLEKRALQLQLSVASVSDKTVSFLGSGGFDVVTTGAMAHADFGLGSLPASYLVESASRAPLGAVTKTVAGSLVEQKYRGYYNNDLNWFNTAIPDGVARLETSIRKGDEGSEYSYTWKGTLRPKLSGEHEFWTRSDDASHVVIDNAVIVNNGGIHGPTDRSGSISLVADRTYAITVYFGENHGGAEMWMQWRGPGENWQTDLSPILAPKQPAARRAITATKPRSQATDGDAIKNGIVNFAHFGPMSADVLAERIKTAGRMSTCHALTLKDASRVVAAHDLSAAASPIVPEVLKAANLQAISVAFSADKTGKSHVSVYVLPRFKGVPPASLHFQFVGNDLKVTYLLQSDSVGASPSTVMSNAANQNQRDVVTLPGARSGTSDTVTVMAEVVRGKMRVATVEPGRQRGFLLQAPTFLRDDAPLQTDALDPPAMMVDHKNVDKVIVLPFAVGNLMSLTE